MSPVRQSSGVRETKGRAKTRRWTALQSRWGIFVVAPLCTTARDAHATETCIWKTNSGCAFGQYSGSQLDTTGTMTVNCSAVDGTAITLEIHRGGNGGSETTRYLSNPSLTYQFYQDAARTQYWGSAPNAPFIANPVIGDNTVTVYCRIPSGQTPANGSYTDSCNAHMKYGGVNSINATPASASVNGLCSMSVTTHLSFGAYDPIVTNKTSALDGTATLSVNCTTSVPYKITLGQGSNPAGGSTDAVPLRQMANGTHRLGYFLYKDTGRTTVWGNTPATGVAGTGIGSAQSFTAYARIPAGQNAATGSYSETVLLTLTF